MNHPNDNNQDLDDLLRQVDALLDDDNTDDWYGEDEIDVDEYAPDDTRAEPDVPLYQNYSNGYGRNVSNYANGYGGRAAPEQPARSEPSIPAYNADFQSQSRRSRREQYPQMGQDADFRESARKSEYRDYGQPESAEPPKRSSRRRQQETAPEAAKTKPPKKRKGCGCGCSTMLIALAMVALCVFGLVQWLFQPPQSEASIGERKSDTATILICGTDEDGTRTDTMMLLYLSGSEHRVGLLSIPRDTYTITSGGYAAKLNSAYGRNGCGEEGMEGLLDYIQDIIGYRPDGYILVDMTLVSQLVDLMGGVEAEVPNTFDTATLHLEAGLQQLNGDQVLALLRHRATYATADLARVEVQRSVIKACMEQWISFSSLPKLGSALELLENNSTSTLTTRNYLWMGLKILTNLNNFSNDTLPGYADYIADASYYILYRDQVAEMINSGYNPYKTDISASDLNIAG